jgi:hypothetical protein
MSAIPISSRASSSGARIALELSVERGDRGQRVDELLPVEVLSEGHAAVGHTSDPGLHSP